MLSHPTTALPRKDRDLARGRIAADRVRAEGGTPTDAALEHVQALIDRSAEINRLKLHVENAMCRGAVHPLVRQRYAAHALFVAKYGLNLDEAAAYIDGHLSEARDLMARDPRFGRAARTRIQTLNEIRLLLRWLRRYRPSLYVEIVRAVAKPVEA